MEIEKWMMKLLLDEFARDELTDFSLFSCFLMMRRNEKRNDFFI